MFFSANVRLVFHDTKLLFSDAAMGGILGHHELE